MPRSAVGTLPSPILARYYRFGPPNDEDLSFRDLDDDDSDQSAPLPPDYDGGDDTDGNHVMTGSRVIPLDATRISSRIKKNIIKKLKAAAAAKQASPEPAEWKKGKGRKRGKGIKSKNAVESDEEDREAVKTGDKRARPHKDDGVA